MQNTCKILHTFFSFVLMPQMDEHLFHTVIYTVFSVTLIDGHKIGGKCSIFIFPDLHFHQRPGVIIVGEFHRITRAFFQLNFRQLMRDSLFQAGKYKNIGCVCQGNI